MRNHIDSNKWPVIWRVVAPAAGSYGHDMVFLETSSQKEAEVSLKRQQRGGWPVRLERVQCGPLPDGFRKTLGAAAAANPQNDGYRPQPAAAWSQ